MASTASQLSSAAHPKPSARFVKVLAPICDSVALVLLPPLLALLISAAFMGHGEISAKSILEVLNTMAQAATTTIAAP